jgi:antitoxin CptB
MNAETIEFARLRWQCRRGMLELDLLFEHFIASEYDNLDTKTKALFHELLTFADQDLFDYFFSNRPYPDKDVADVIDYIRRTATA